MAKINRHKFDESQYVELEAYMASGCEGELSASEREYLELLSRTDKLSRKYGMSASIGYLEKEVGVSQYTAKQIYYEAINLFYKDIDIDVTAMKHWLMEKYIKASELIISTAKSSKDVDVYKNTLIRIEEILESIKVDDVKIGVDLSRPYKIYSLKPEDISLPVADRNETAKLIDSMKKPDKITHRLKRDAGIIKYDIAEVLDEQEEDHKEIEG